MGRWGVLLVFPILATSVEGIPAFTKPAYNATIHENSRGKTYLKCWEKMGLQLNSNSKELDFDVRFKIVAGDKEKFFKTEEKFVGDFVFLMIRTRTGNTHVLNRERKDRYTLVAKAEITRRGSKPIEIETIVYVSILDRNDLNPLFYPPVYEVIVTEDTKLHTSILKVNAEDADLGINGELYYYFRDKTEQFSIHPTTGAIILTRPLRYADQSLHQLIVVAKDRGGGKPTFGNVTFHVKQVNLFGPEIYVHPLPAVIENANTDVYAIVRVLDQDEGVHGQIRSLEIVEGDPEGNFNVRLVKKDSKLGYEYHIELLNSLDREAAPKGYNLTLKAVDCGLPQKYSYKTLHVSIIDTNDNKPIFEKNFYEVDISENTPPNSPILRIKVSDADMAENSLVVYEISSTNADAPFTVNPSTGMIYTVSWLDAEQTSFYSLIVTATDKAIVGTRKQSTTSVKVNIIDANDNDPVFENNEVTIYIDENGSPGTSVTTVSAHDDDSGENSYISYSIANLKTVPFEIDHFSGVVRTTQVLDYESSRRNYVLKIRASDWGLPYRRQTEMQLKVIVKDINDNRPQFEKVDCTGRVPRLSPIGTELLTLSAIDFDGGNIVTYRILTGNEDECFSLDISTGVLSVACDLNDLSITQRELNMTATDGIHYADTTSIVIILTTMSNNLSADKIAFKCKNTGVANRWAEIMGVAEKNNVNQEEFAMMPIRYGQNAHSPEFINFPVQIIVNESVPIGNIIVKIKANDRDRGYNGELVYGISQGDLDSVFQIDPENGNLRTVGYLDRERESEYLLNVTVYDMGSPRKSTSKYLPIIVLDVNDNAPKFEKTVSSFRVTENAVNGTVIYLANATDPDIGDNGKVSYSIVSDSNEFAIDSETGVLSVAGLLDHEKRSFHEIVVRASDCAGSGQRDALFADSIVKVYIDDVNDNAPKFSGDKFKVTIPEDLPPGVVIAIISAVDLDLEEGGQILYSLPDPTDAFEIDRLTGTIRLRKELDYELAQGFSLTVQAQDQGVPSLSSTTVLIVEVTDVNENEHPPSFPDLVTTVNVKEGLPSGTLIATVTASDLDPPGRDSNLYYRITSGSGLGYFVINDQGEIRTSLILDAEAKPFYWLTIACEDQGVVPLSSVLQVYVEIEDVNDEIPLTLQPFYQGWVLEESDKVTDVVVLRASDGDVTPSQIFFSITGGDPDHLYSLNETSGLIKTTGKKMDRESKSEYVLEVTVKDSGSPSLFSVTKVFIEIIDVNDNPPVFDQTIHYVTVPELILPPSYLPQNDMNSDESFGAEELEGIWESFPPDHQDGIPLFNVLASDKDAGHNAEVFYSLKGSKGTGTFSINPETGMLYTQRSLLRGHQYSIMVMARDKGNPALNTTTRVSIKVEGIPLSSRHSPVIKNPNQIIQILESDLPGYIVTIINAHDMDEDTIYFNISEGNGENRFIIGKDKGAIYLAKPVDAETQRFHNLTISVTDGVHTAYTQVSIEVLDINEHSPVFSKKEYHLAVIESIEVGTVIMTLNATDDDVGKKLVYKIYNSENAASVKLFSLDHNSGDLIVSNTLDRETLMSHKLTILVHDSSTPTKKNFTRVIIKVEDVNDRMPIFNVHSLEAKIYRSSGIGSRIITVIASDHDLMENGTIIYSIASGNEGGKFTIDPVLGDLCLAKLISPTDASEYSVVIQASDSGVQPLHNTLPVHISVITSTEGVPKFLDSEFTAEVYENSPVGTFVIQLEAHGWGLLFQITNGNSDASFIINPTTGTINVNNELDKETIDVYNLTVSAFSMFGGKSHCMVTIYILDVNDNPPEFIKDYMDAWILETAEAGSFILDKEGKPLVPEAVDNDSHTNSMFTYQFFSKHLSSMFHIDPNTGSIRTVVSLDFEKIPRIIISLIAIDKGIPKLTSESIATVNLTVVNVNDSPPVFSQLQYNATILLPPFDEITITQVTAVDADFEGNNTELIYAISPGIFQNIYSVDVRSGLIRVKDKSKIQGPSIHKLSLTATDGKYSCETIVNVHWIQNYADKAIVFEKKVYFGAVLENSTQSITVAVVSVKGASLNDHVVFSILNPQPQFTIGAVSGALKTTGAPLDREVQETYSFLVQAERVNQESKDVFDWHIARTQVNVTVLDINDNCPVVLNKESRAVVSQSARKHHFVARVMAHDSDKEENGEVHFELENHYDVFKICTRSGNITIKQQIPASIQEYKLIITVRDNGIPPCSTKAIIHISVLDDDSPIFEQQYYQVHIGEDIALHTAIPLTLRTFSPLTNDIIYSIIEGDIYDEFSVGFGAGSATGTSPCVILVRCPLDYESTDTYNLRIRAIDAVTDKYSDTVVEILIQDINDNAPEFSQDIYNVSVPETLNIGEFVGQVHAIDRDVGLNGVVRYTIDDDINERSSFFMRSNTGEIFLKKTLDFETKAFYSLRIKAFDTGVPSKSSYARLWIHVVDVIDTSPVIVEPNVGLLYGTLATRGQFVSLLRSFHSVKEVKLSYALLTHDAAFSLDKEKGILTVANPLNLTRGDMKVGFSVTDGVFSSTSYVHIKSIKANEFSPKFEKYLYEVAVKENIAKGTHVIRLAAADDDLGQVGTLKYAIVSKSTHDAFTINPDSGDITTSAALDRESRQYYEFLVKASDPGNRCGFAIVLVTIIDVNDNRPIFVAPKYSTTVFAGTAINTSILQVGAKVEAIDKDVGQNAAITYSLIGDGKVEKQFIMDPKAGIVHAKMPFQLKKDTAYQFFVRATDGGSTPWSTDVPVTVYFSASNLNISLQNNLHNSFFISESAETGTVVTTLEKLVESKVNHQVFGETKGIVFIDSEGKVVLNTTLDHETVTVHKLAILTETRTSPPISYVTHLHIHVLDINDNNPKFEQAQYEIYVMEGVPVGERILKVKAHDIDEGKNGEIHYWLEGDQNVFAIERRSGWLYTHSDLDRENKPNYSLKIIAFDNGNPALSDKTTVKITLLDANDNPPTFVHTTSNISISEDSAVGTFLMELEMTDADETSQELEFFITFGDKDCNFEMDVRGKLFLSKKLDREETSQYIITVMATDGKFTASANIVIHVLDVNDEKPQCLKEFYSVQISEDVQAFTYITTIEAYDPDSEPNYHFSLKKEDTIYFVVNSATGELRTNALLDRETVSQHVISVQVSDRGNESWNCQSTVLIKLVDVNDCPPKFESTNIKGSVIENAPVGSVVIMVQATDLDLASNAKVKYSILESSRGKFRIDSKTGLVQLNGKVDREEKDKYYLKIRASDENAPELYSDATLVITILDVNDNPPVFSQNVYHSQISESAPLQTQFLRLEAFSSDLGENSEVLYLVISGDPNGMFTLHSTTGILGVAKLLDFETTKNYMLSVEAKDLGDPPLSTRALVNISVIDSNDNTPIFLQTLYTTVISEDVGVSSTILQVIASDADNDKNGKIVYSIESGDLHNQFSVDPVTGYITVISSLDREEKDRYTLIIKATDQGIPSLSSTATIAIEVSDVNDNPPRFSSQNYSTFLQEGKERGWPLMKLVVSDADLEQNGEPYEFDIQSGNEGHLFTIGADGVIKNTEVLRGLLNKVFVLHVRAYDSGTPPLYSDAVVTVKVTEESMHPPAIIPLAIVVMSYENQLRKCFLGVVHIKDPDPYDSHKFMLEGDYKGFSVDEMSGHLSMADLDPGVYNLTIRVTDGKFTSSASISVTVRSIVRNMLLSAFSLRLKGMSAKYFIITGWKTILRFLKKLLKTDIVLLSIQPAYRDLDVLLSFQEYVSLEELNKVLFETRISVVLLKCHCQNGGKCKQSVNILPDQVITTSTDTESFVAAQHSHILFCACSPAFSGEFCEEATCECPPPTLCSHQGGATVCTSPPPVAPLCADNHTCDLPEASMYTFMYPYVAIIALMTFLISAIAVCIIVWKRKKERRRPNEFAKDEKGRFRTDSEMCGSKISNLTTLQGVRLSTYNNGNEAMCNTLSLNNLESPRNCINEGSENMHCDYLQNINPSTKVRNVEHFDALESPKQSYEMASYGFPQPNNIQIIPKIDH